MFTYFECLLSLLYWKNVLWLPFKLRIEFEWGNEKRLGLNKTGFYIFMILTVRVFYEL